MNKLAATILLALGAEAGDTKYFSGNVFSEETFLYGKFRTRMQGADLKGTFYNFITMWTGDNFANFDDSDWNLMEISVFPTHGTGTNIMYGDHESRFKYHNWHPDNAWHDYEIEWTPDYILYTVDNKVVRKEHGSAFQRAQRKRQNISMSFWTPYWDAENLDDSQLPAYTKHDYVKAWDYDEATGDFTLRFMDDFKTFDENRWIARNDITFEGNSSKFMKTHAYVENGNLVLKMDKKLNPEQPNPQPEPVKCDEPDYGALMYGDQCTSKDNKVRCQACNSSCHQSWPARDPNKWDSDKAMCNCLPW